MVIGSLHFLRLSKGPDFHEEVLEDEFDDDDDDDVDKLDEDEREEESREDGDEVKRCEEV